MLPYAYNNATAFTFTVTALAVTPSMDGFSNVVVAADFRMAASRDGYAAETFTSETFAEPSANTFVDYSALDNDTVVGWLKDARGDHLTILYREADMVIDAQIAANTVETVMWVDPVGPQP